MIRQQWKRGSSTVVVLAVLVVLSFLFSGTVLYLEITTHGLRRHQEETENHRIMRGEAELVVTTLSEDPTPFADSPNDPVWMELDRIGDGGTSVRIKDLSSRIGLNWVRKELLNRIDVLLPGQSPEQLQQYREDTGIHMNISSAFARFFPQRTILELFTPYSYFNMNVSDEFALRKVYALRTGDPAEAEVFRMKIQSLRTESRELTAEELPSFLGPEVFEEVFPVLNCEPGINVHFAPKEVLSAVFGYSGIPLDIVPQIVSVRASTEWSLESLSDLIGPGYREGSLDQYLGVRTWFWEITVFMDDMQLHWVIARVPDAEDRQEQPVFRLLEEDFRP